MFNYVYYYMFIIDSDSPKIDVITLWGICSCQCIQHEIMDEIHNKICCRYKVVNKNDYHQEQQQNAF